MYDERVRGHLSPINSNSMYMKDLSVIAQLSAILRRKYVTLKDRGVYATLIPIADIRLRSAGRMTGHLEIRSSRRSLKRAMLRWLERVIRLSGISNIGRGEAVAAGIGVDSAGQSESVDEGWDGVGEDEGSSGEDTDEGEHGAVPEF
jgi:hypothetical protein